MANYKCSTFIQIINTICIIGGFIGVMVGSSLIPQTVVNNGNIYIGSAEQYNADIKVAQLSSYGFKVSIISLGVFTYGMLTCVSIVVYNRMCKREPIHPALTISPVITVDSVKVIKSILKLSSNSLALKININKWTGRVPPHI